MDGWDILNSFGLYNHRNLDYDHARHKYFKLDGNWVVAAQYSDRHTHYYQLKHGNAMYSPAVQRKELTVSLARLAPLIVATASGELFSAGNFAATTLFLGLKINKPLKKGNDRKHPMFEKLR